MTTNRSLEWAKSRRSLFALGLVFVLSSGLWLLRPKTSLNGVYYAPRDNFYLRFYPDGTVLLGFTSRPLDNPWAAIKKSSSAGHGRYGVQLNQLTAKISDDLGTVTYSGRVEGEKLVLKTSGDYGIADIWAHDDTFQLLHPAEKYLKDANAD